MASLLLRPLDVISALRLDLGRQRSIRVADASLRALGSLVRRVVLDSWPALGSGLRVVGVRAGLCELVPARLRQPRGVRPQRQHRQAVLLVVLLAVELLDGRRRAAFRIRLRQPAGRPRGSCVRGAESASLRLAHVGTGLPRGCRSARGRADPHGRHERGDVIRRQRDQGQPGGSPRQLFPSRRQSRRSCRSARLVGAAPDPTNDTRECTGAVQRRPGNDGSSSRSAQWWIAADVPESVIGRRTGDQRAARRTRRCDPTSSAGLDVRDKPAPTGRSRSAFVGTRRRPQARWLSLVGGKHRARHLPSVRRRLARDRRSSTHPGNTPGRRWLFRAPSPPNRGRANPHGSNSAPRLRLSARHPNVLRPNAARRRAVRRSGPPPANRRSRPPARDLPLIVEVTAADAR